MGNPVLSPDENGKFSILQESCKKPKNKFEIGRIVNKVTDEIERRIKVYLSIHSLSFIYPYFNII
jgi:hypothetical protein